MGLIYKVVECWPSLVRLEYQDASGRTKHINECKVYNRIPRTANVGDSFTYNLNTGKYVPWSIQDAQDALATPRAWVKVEDRHPHTCPNCGQKAYVGLIQVEHQDGKYTC